jgi:dTDP-4-amino-4,6-dideoxygalactose transaminase
MKKYKIRLHLHDLDDQAVRALRGAVLTHQSICGAGIETRKCQAWLKKETKSGKVLLTASCTDALEMAALLANLGSGDEVIMPSFTFSSTATAVALRGARPVFVDIRPDTQNIDESLIEAAITKHTCAICPVHYAGVGCNMDAIMRIARKHRLLVIEDAAQAVGSTYKGKVLGSIGHLGAYSFHDSKVVTAGEGGALLVNAKKFERRAEILWEKGTNRLQMMRGEVGKYTWVDIGSSFLMSDLSASLLFTQLKISSSLIRERLARWKYYVRALKELEDRGFLRLPFVPDECRHNGHIFYILLNNKKERDALMAWLQGKGIEACFHYIPLHSAPAGRRYGRVASDMTVTNATSRTLLRLPLYAGLMAKEQEYVIDCLYAFFGVSR